MALVIWGSSRCSICGEKLFQGQLVVATTHFIADQADPLWRFSDSGMHAECFTGWEHRDEFAARYYAASGRKLTGWVPAVSTIQTAPKLPKCQLLVLGTAEARAGYFAVMVAAAGRNCIATNNSRTPASSVRNPVGPGQ